MIRLTTLMRHGKESQIFSGVYMDAVKGGPTQILRPGQGQQKSVTFSGSPMPRRSGLQWEVLGLYRKLQKAANTKDDPATRQNLRSAIRDEFKKEASLPRRNVNKIEWCMNRARVKLEEINAMKPGIRFAMVR